MPAGEAGEILCRGDTVMAGYWQNPEASAATLRGGFLHTGDVGAFDADGYLTLKDRSKDMIISGGSNIYPREVEEVLLKHAGVREVSVIGRPDREWGEVVVAYVVGDAPAGRARRAVPRLRSRASSGPRTMCSSTPCRRTTTARFSRPSCGHATAANALSRSAEMKTALRSCPNHPPPCPICGKPARAAVPPFCSKRCADVDLNRWLSGVYAVPWSRKRTTTGRRKVARRGARTVIGVIPGRERSERTRNP